MKRWSLALLACLCVTACTDAPASTEDAGDIPVERLASTLFTDSLRSERTYRAFATEGGGFGQAGHSLKFVIDARSGSADPYFTNSNYRVAGVIPAYAQYHYEFCREVLGIEEDAASFNANSYYTNDKRYIGGSLQTYQLHGEVTPTYAIQFYPDDVIHEEGLLAAIRMLRPALRIPGARYAFVATGPQQTFARVAASLRALGVEPMTLDDVLGSVRYLPLNAGEAWGYLRIFPRDPSLLRASDIVVFDELPLDLSVVAGTITRGFQDVTSHVNLKAKERGTPNMMLRDAGPDSPEMAPLLDQPVHLVVGKTGYLLEPSSAEVVEQKLRERMNTPWVELPVLQERALRDYDAMCPVLNPGCVQDGGRYGGKANGLGFLANASVLGRRSAPPSLSATMGYDLAPFGFAIPVWRYRELLAQNPALASALEDFIGREKGGALSPAERARAIASLQAMFYAADLPEAHLREVESAMAALKTRFPQVSELKFRSSANAEDIPGFDGAGLYDSFSVKYSARDDAARSCAVVADVDGVVTKLKVEPRTAQCALKAVYASLWNQRAVEERSYARIDHASAAMGIAVVPAYDSESEVVANGVILTRAIGADDVIGYTVTLQQGNNLVTNPAPGTLAQRTLVTFSADTTRPDRFTVVRPAVSTAGAAPLTGSILPDAKLAEIVRVARSVEHAYCAMKPAYGAPRPGYEGSTRGGGGRCEVIEFFGGKSAALDMEFKILADGRIVLKQVREFHGQ